MSTAHALIDLCAYPSVIQQLREEVEREKAGHTSPWEQEAVNRLKLMDSFLKESQRFNPPNYRK
jgi:cytochrome P450